MNVAFVSTILSYRWGGADGLWTAAADLAVDRGDHLLIAVSGLAADHTRIAALTKRQADLFIRRLPIGPTAFWRRALYKIAGTARSGRLLARLRTFAPDLVILSCGGTYDIIQEAPLIDWVRSTRTPYRIIANLQHEHPFLEEPDRQRAREMLAAADRVFCVSPRNLAITRRHLMHPLPNAECLHGCGGHVSIVPASESEWPAQDPWCMAILARLEPIKGLDILIQALSAALGDTPGWRLNIYGDGPQLGYLKECAHFCGVGERIHFVGFDANLDGIWQQNHLLVSSSIDEGVPMTIPEAMLRGRAVLATRIGGAEEWIEPGVSGFICPAPTVELLTESLFAAWIQRGRWREMGKAAAIRARALYRPNDYQRIIA